MGAIAMTFDRGSTVLADDPTARFGAPFSVAVKVIWSPKVTERDPVAVEAAQSVVDVD